MYFFLSFSVTCWMFSSAVSSNMLVYIFILHRSNNSRVVVVLSVPYHNIHLSINVFVFHFISFLFTYMNWDALIQLIQPFRSISTMSASHTIPTSLDSSRYCPQPFYSNRSKIKVASVTVGKAYLKKSTNTEWGHASFFAYFKSFLPKFSKKHATPVLRQANQDRSVRWGYLQWCIPKWCDIPWLNTHASFLIYI